MDTGIAKGPEFDNCSNACVFYFPAGLHDEACTPLAPPTEAEREATRAEYQRLRVHAQLMESQKTYNKKNHLQRGKRE